MKKWLLIVVITLLLCCISIASMYSSTMNNKMGDLDLYFRYIEQETNGTIHEVHRFHGTSMYVIFSVEEEDGYYYYAVREDGEVNAISFDDIQMSKQQITDSVNLPEVLRVSPAFTGNAFTWEVVAIDEEDSLQYVYYYMKDGTFQQRYKLRNKPY